MNCDQHRGHWRGEFWHRVAEADWDLQTYPYFLRMARRMGSEIDPHHRCSSSSRIHRPRMLPPGSARVLRFFFMFSTFFCNFREGKKNIFLGFLQIFIFSM